MRRRVVPPLLLLLAALVAADVVLETEEGEVTVHLRTRTDEEGRFRLEGVPPGTHGVSLRGMDIGHVMRPRAQVTVRDGTTTPQDLVLGRMAVEGCVRDAVTGRPLAEVRGDLVGTYAPFSTDATGTYRVLDLPPGSYRLWFARDGYQGRGSDTIGVREGQVAGCDVELTPTAVPHLWITDARGAPVVGDMTLVISPKEQDGTATSVGTGVTAEADGHAVYRQIVPADYELIVIDPAAGRGSAAVAIRPGENTVRIRLE